MPPSQLQVLSARNLPPGYEPPVPAPGLSRLWGLPNGYQLFPFYGQYQFQPGTNSQYLQPLCHVPLTLQLIEKEVQPEGQAKTVRVLT